MLLIEMIQNGNYVNVLITMQFYKINFFKEKPEYKFVIFHLKKNTAYFMMSDDYRHSRPVIYVLENN